MRVATDRLEVVYRDEGPRLWRALVAFTGSSEIADDALAEAFAQVLARDDAVRDPAAWAWRVAFRIAAGELKERGRRGTARSEPTIEFPEPLLHVFAALERLSPNQRLAVVLHDYADRPTDEVAATLGVTRATVRVHLSQGRRRLRVLLEEHDD